GRPVVDRIEGSRHHNMEGAPSRAGWCAPGLVHVRSASYRHPPARRRQDGRMERVVRGCDPTGRRDLRRVSRRDPRRRVDLMPRTSSADLGKEVLAGPGAAERIAKSRADTLEEIRLYELRHREAVSQATLAGRLDVTQGAISKLEHSDDVRVSTLRQYLD